MGGGASVAATLIPGIGTYPVTPALHAAETHPGPVNLNFPAVNAQDFAAAVLGGILDLPYAVDPAAKATNVTLITPRPVARADVLQLVEDALRSAGLVLILKGGAYTITPLAQATAQAPPVGPDQPGFGNETIMLKYANPVELKKLLDPIVPGVITAADAASGTMVLSGSDGQRHSVRDLVQQFDVDWLKGMSFALFIPKNTDARLIAPELDKLINAPGSTTAGLVRLVAMDKLNGIVAIASRAAFLDDVRRWVEVLDRAGESSERRLYVYRVQNGRASDLAQVLISAFGGGSGTGGGGQKPPFSTSASSGGIGGSGPTSGGFGSSASNSGISNSGGSSLGGGVGAGPNASPSLSTLSGGQTLPGQSASPTSGSVRIGASADSLVVTSDETNNAVVAYATPREYALIEDALQKLDITPLQVVIEAAIGEVTLTDELQYGTQFFLQEHNYSYSLTQSTTSAAAAAMLPGLNYVLGTKSIAATLSALSQVTHVTILSAPNLMVLNNQTASLQVGSEVPISTGSAVSTVSADAPVVNAITYQDTGIILKVTPRVNSSGLVLLDVSQEVSGVVASATNPINSPVISERKIATSVAVQDGQTVAMGGLISDSVSTTRSGIPFLSAIPVLGALASTRNNNRTRTELIVLLTPRVIRNPDDAKAITDELRQKIKFVEPLRPKFEP
jgi:general secretion pathway protein D